MRTVVLAAALTLVAGSLAPADEGKTIRVHISGRTQEALSEPVRKAREKETEEERKRAEKALKDLRKTLQARHGKRSADWPEEANREFAQAWRAELLATLAHQEVKVSPQDILDSADDLTKALRDEIEESPGIELAAAADEADLAVEVLARRARSGFPAAIFAVYLKLSPVGGAEGGGRFAEDVFRQHSRRETDLGELLGRRLASVVSSLHDYSEAEPYWTIEVAQQGASYRHVAWTAAEVLAAFAAGLAGPVETGGERP